MKLFNKVTGLWERWNSTDGKAHVEVNFSDAGTAVITVVSGTVNSRTMLPVANASFNTANGQEFFSDATGVKSFQAIPGIAIDATAKALIIAFSTTANDTANITALLDAAAAAIGTPAGAAITGVIVITPQSNLSAIQWPKYDGTNLFKSIGMCYVGALASGWVNLQTVE